MTRQAPCFKLALVFNSAPLLASRLAAAALIVGALATNPQQASAQATSSRLALVIGEAGYRNGPLSTAANDAGLIADTLQKAGFDVTGAADLDQDGLRRTLRDFVDKASVAGSDATVFVYLSGRGLQYEGENYLAPVDAVIPGAVNVPLEAVRLSDYLRPLAQMPLKARIVVLDAARINAFAQNGAPLAGGLALVEPNPGELIAFNAAPGSVAPAETGPYGVYAQALNEMLREGGLPLDAAFARTRLRVSDQTRGAQVPWSESKLSPAPALFARAPGAPPPAVAFETQANMRARPIRDFPVDQAYGAALEQDTLAAYVEFLNAYPNSAYAERVRAMLALRREALTWRRAWLANTPDAYWTYLQYYPRGPHAEDARRRLALLSMAPLPPPRFDVYAFDVPPPSEAEEIYFNRPYVVFDDPAWGAPPPMTYLLPERPFLVERPPAAPPYAGLLPLPLLAAPLLFAIPAVRQGFFHAPAAVTAKQPGADAWYSSHSGKPSGAPGAAAGAPAAAAPLPAAPNGAPLPHGPQGQNGAPPAVGNPNGKPLPHPANAPGGAPVGAALPHGQQAPGAAPPAGKPLPHPANASGGAPGGAPGGTALPHPPNAPNAAPGGAPAPQGQKTPNASPPAAPHPADAPRPAAAPAPPAPPPHQAAPPAPHPDAPKPKAEPPHSQPPRPEVAPIAPPIARPIAPPVAPPMPHLPTPLEKPQPLAGPPKAEPPHGAQPQQQRPHCGAPGEPPCH